MSSIVEMLRAQASGLLSGDPAEVEAATATLGQALRRLAATAPSPARRAELQEATIWAVGLLATARRGARIGEEERRALTGGRTGPAALLSGRA